MTQRFALAHLDGREHLCYRLDNTEIEKHTRLTVDTRFSIVTTAESERYFCYVPYADRDCIATDKQFVRVTTAFNTDIKYLFYNKHALSAFKEKALMCLRNGNVCGAAYWMVRHHAGAHNVGHDFLLTDTDNLYETLSGLTSVSTRLANGYVLYRTRLEHDLPDGFSTDDPTECYFSALHTDEKFNARCRDSPPASESGARYHEITYFDGEIEHSFTFLEVFGTYRSRYLLTEVEDL